MKKLKKQMKNPLTAILHKMRDSRKTSIEAENNDRANSDIYVANDVNDPENGIYVFVCGVPVAKVLGTLEDREVASVFIDNVGEYLATLKAMYRNSLEGEKIEQQKFNK